MPFLKKGGSDYRIGRQDLLQISVFDLKELDQTVRVADDGSITLPLLGRLSVAGLTKGELEATIARLLEERYVRNPQVTIFVKEYESKKVAVSGAVKKPGTYEMLGEKTLLEMISQAGGLDAEPGKQIYIFRQNNDGGEAQRLAVDLDRLVYRAEAALNVALAPGDIVYVPNIEKVRIFVSGAVRNPNLYEVPRDELFRREAVEWNAPDGGKDALRSAQALLAGAGISYTSEIRRGYIPQEIANYAKELNCSAIIMGTRGMGSTEQIFGSIVRQVVALTLLPVTLVK